jgi:hypothetical protein
MKGLGILVFALALGTAAVFGQDRKPADESDGKQQTGQEAKAGDSGQAGRTSDSRSISGGDTTANFSVDNPAQAQAKSQTPSPSPDLTGPYIVNWDTEVGWRFKETDGNVNEYRSQLNYDRGLRLMSGDFLARPRNCNGTLFDNIYVNSIGLGGDPTQYMNARIEKTGWYTFVSTYRRFAYFNNLANLALGQHTADNTYELGDFDLTLLPQNRRFKLYLGYSLERNKGHAVTTYDYSRNEFPVLSPVTTHADDYRLGFDARLWIFDISFTQGFRHFKNDTTYNISAPQKGNSSGSTLLATFHRDLPLRGQIPFTSLSLHPNLGPRWDITGRIIYASEKTGYTFFETVTGTDSSGNHVLLDQTSINGNAKEPNTLGNLGASYQATCKLTISDQFRYNSFRINGGDRLIETLLTSKNLMLLPPVLTDMLSFQLLSYRILWNSIEGDYAFNPRLSAHLGYSHGDRRVVLADYTVPPGGNLASPADSNSTDAVFGGFRARPWDWWTLYFDFEHGTSDNVFTRVASYNYTNFRVRSVMRPRKTLAINTSLMTYDNTNPTLAQVGTTFIPFGVDAKARIFSSSVDWTPGPNLSFNSGYTYSHLDSNAAITFFLNSVQTLGRSKYFLRDHFFFGTANIQVHPRATLFVGFRVNHDPEQDLGTPSPVVLASAYPYQLATPEARVCIKMMKQLDWNTGWQYFDYHDKLFSNLSYRAHIGYVSLTVRFNRQ